MLVRTVCGDIDSASLGATHCHDHLFVFQIDGADVPKKLILDDFKKTKDEVLRFKQAGGQSILDAQPFGAGRNSILLRKLSEETGINIVAVTGLHKAGFYKSGFWSFNASVKELAELFISEIQEGMYAYDYKYPFSKRTDIKTGVIKVASDAKALTGYYQKIFNAAIIAHTETKAPILTHSENSNGLEQAKYLIDNGVSAEKIIVCHMDRKIDLDKNIKLAKLGVYLEYDTIARLKYHCDEEEVNLIKEMIDCGFGEQLLLGMDSTRERFESYGNGIGLDHLILEFIPMLKKTGICNSEIETMIVKNPQRALSFL